MSTLGLAALGLTAVFGLAVVIAFPTVGQTILRILQGTFLLLLALTLIGLLVMAITNIDIDPYIRHGAVVQTGHRLVDFYTLLPEQYRVQEVVHEDTDGDGHEEWIVFYQFDLADGRSPYAGAVYDSDRGNPPVLFPYRLLPPDRDYLSEEATYLQLEDAVEVGESQPTPELFVYGNAGGVNTDLTVFRHVPNSFDWEFPRDEPRRYQVIGAFRGDGGVYFNRNRKTVTVNNRAGYDRSQLAIQTVYALDETRGTYMSVTNPQQLDAPLSSRVVFAFGMPSDILDTPYPEKLILGFYHALAQTEPIVEPRSFLTGQAFIEYEKGNMTYFGFSDAPGDISEVQVTQLSYSPGVEQFDPSVTVLGEEPRSLTVNVAFEAKLGKTDMRTPTPIQWVTSVINGKWKIDRRL
jgi:hypothetical protein